MKTARFLDIDFCKGLLIILVVWGHFCAHSSGVDYEKNVITMYVRLFQMPLFFMISGFFQKKIRSYSELKVSINKTFFRLGLPLLSWSAADYLVRGFVQGSWGGGVLSFFWGGFNLYWFFTCLILCKLLFSLVDFISYRFQINHYVSHVIGVLVLLLLPRDLFCFPFNYLFYVLGVVLMSKKLPSIPTLYFIIGCILTLVLGYFYPTKWTFYGVNMYIFDHSVPFKPLFIIVRWSIYTIATLTAFELFRRIYNAFLRNKLVATITKLGNKTLLIYGFHILLVADIYGYYVKVFCGEAGLLPNYPWIRYYVLSTALTIVTIFVCELLDKVMHKSNIISVLFLGERNNA